MRAPAGSRAGGGVGSADVPASATRASARRNRTVQPGIRSTRYRRLVAMADDTRDLLLRWRTGDEAAFAALVHEHTPWIEQVVHRRLGPRLRRRVGAEDIVQQALVE